MASAAPEATPSHEDEGHRVSAEDQVRSGDQEESEVDGAKSNVADSEGESKEEQEGEGSSAAFECNICLDTAHDAVISLCGHLFCWPCLHQWLEMRQPARCPVCKAGISKEKVIPLYGRGGDQKDPREKVPPRPKGQRPEPENTGGGFFNPFGFNVGGGGNGGFQMSFGIGAFPFGIFATNFNIGGGGGNNAQGRGGFQPNGPQPGTAQFNEEAFLQKVFLWVAFAFIFWLMIA